MAKRNNNNGNGNGNRRRKPRKGNTTSRQTKNLSGNGLSNRGALRRPMINRSFVESGSDFLGPLTVKATPQSAAERILLSNSISPSAFPGTRLTQLSNLWERYRFRKFRLRWVPAVPKTIACQLIIYQDTDPLDDPTIITDPDALVRQATAQAGSQQFNFINAMSIDLSKRADDQLYYTGDVKQNERFSRQGNFYVIQVTNPLNFNGEALPSDIMSGSLYVDWVCEFQIAQINPSAVVAALGFPTPIIEVTPTLTLTASTATLIVNLACSVSLSHTTGFSDTGPIELSLGPVNICTVDGVGSGFLNLTSVLIQPGSYIIAETNSNTCDVALSISSVSGLIFSFLPT